MLCRGVIMSQDSYRALTVLTVRRPTRYTIVDFCESVVSFQLDNEWLAQHQINPANFVPGAEVVLKTDGPTSRDVDLWGGRELAGFWFVK